MDAEDNREDMDFDDEMQGLNNPTNSPLSSAYGKVMRAPVASPENPKIQEKQIPTTPVIDTPEKPKEVNDEQTLDSNPTEEANIEVTTVTPEEKAPTTKENQIEQCLNLINNAKNRKKIPHDKTQQAAESLAVFFKIDDFEKLENGTIEIEEYKIFPSISRPDLNKEQTAILDRILDPMEPIWFRKFKHKVRIIKKSKRSRVGDSPKASPPTKSAKSDE